MRTRDKLATELRKVAEQAGPENAAKYEAFAVRAATGEFDDYADTYACPITQLHSELCAAGFTQFAKRVAQGEFDATKEESDEWANSPAGRETFAHLSPGVAAALGQPQTLGDGPVQSDYLAMMKDVARFIDDLFNGAGEKKTGFILMAFPLNDHEGRCNYMSNASREDVVVLLKEQLARFEGQPEIVGHA